MEPERDLLARAEALVAQLKARGLKLATAESCTGGLVAATLTDAPGSSEIYDRGVVTYSNQAKADLLGVPQALLDQHGAVSEPVARAMAAGALERLGADIAVSVTGIAGPGGGSSEKPVGLVFFGAALKSGPTLHRERRFGDIGRTTVRTRSVVEAFDMVEELLSAVEK